MGVPDFVDGVLPLSPDGEPYSISPEELVDRFGTTVERRRALLSFCSLKGAIDYLLRDADRASPAIFWVRGAIVTAATDVEEVDALLLLHSASVPANQHIWLLLTILTDGTATQATLRTRLQLVRLENEHMFDLERQRSGRASPVSGGDLRAAGWVVVL